MSGLSIRVSRSALATAVESLMTVVGATEGVHAQLQLSARAGKLILSSTAPDKAKITTLSDVEVLRPGRLVLPAKRFADSLRAAPEGEAELVGLDGSALLTVGQTRWTYTLFAGKPANLPEVGQLSFTPLDGPALAAALGRVKYAASKSQRHLMQIEISTTHVTASDMSRFARVALESSTAFELPTNALAEVQPMLKSTKLQVGIGTRHLVFRDESTWLIISQLAENFPDVEAQLFAPYRRNTDTLTTSRSELQDAIRRARINADPDSSAIVLVLSKKDGLRVETKDKLGNTTLELLSAQWNGSERRLVLHHKNLTEMLDSSEDPTCTLLVGPESTRPSPVIMIGEDGVVGLIQAIRLDWLR